MKISTGDLLIPDLFTMENAVNKQNLSPSSENVRRKMNSLYGSVQFNWDGWLYMDITGRNDWSSTMSKANRSYFYPSVSLSGVISDLINKTTRDGMPAWFTFAKTRVSYAQVGNDLDPYKLITSYSINTDPLGNPIAEMSKVLYDPSVRSELVKSWEAGIELKFFDNRLGIDAAWYKSNSTRQLLEIPIDPFSGYAFKQINAGNIQNTGLEFMIYASPIVNPKGFSWETTLNASTNKNKILELADGVNEFGLRSFTEMNIVARTGSYYGDIYGVTYARVQEGEHAGKIIVDTNGLPIINEEKSYLGNQQADWLFGWTNSFSYKNLSLSFLIDARLGGKIYSATTANLYALGNAEGTVVNGARDKFVVGNAVIEGSNGYEINTIEVLPQDYWERVAGYSNTGLTEEFLKSATNVRLRNITLGYDLDKNG
ncbi:MAG: TonB-dependent receptor [Tannerellaceae bacterium]|nr:TonB-dependent receptor [Tannerellaceae bacterium]